MNIAVASGKGGTGKTTVALSRAACYSSNGVPYDTEVTRAQVAGKSLVEFSGGTTSRILRSMWKDIEILLH